MKVNKQNGVYKSKIIAKNEQFYVCNEKKKTTTNKLLNENRLIVGPHKQSNAFLAHLA